MAELLVFYDDKLHSFVSDEFMGYEICNIFDEDEVISKELTDVIDSIIDFRNPILFVIRGLNMWFINSLGEIRKLNKPQFGTKKLDMILYLDNRKPADDINKLSEYIDEIVYAIDINEDDIRLFANKLDKFINNTYAIYQSLPDVKTIWNMSNVKSANQR